MAPQKTEWRLAAVPTTMSDDEKDVGGERCETRLTHKAKARCARRRNPPGLNVPLIANSLLLNEQGAIGIARGCKDRVKRECSILQTVGGGEESRLILSKQIYDEEAR